MNLKYILAAAVLFLSSMSLPAQTAQGLSVSGRLLDEASRAPLGYASAVLYALPDTAMVTGVITDDKGAFAIQGVKPGKYLLRTSFVGYRTLERVVELGDESLRMGEPLYMTSSLELDEVLVTGTVRERQVTAEKTLVNVSKSAAAANGNIADILRAQPGVTMDADGNIYLRGNKNILVLVDGVPTTLTGLTSMPSSNVDNIEIITSPSVKYDAEGTGGIVNIVTRKKTALEGMSGRANISYSWNGDAFGGLNLQHRKGIWAVDFGYNARYADGESKGYLYREIYGAGMKLRQDFVADQADQAQGAQLLVSAQPSSRHLFTLNVKAMFPKLTNEQDITGTQTLGQEHVEFDRRNETTFSRKVIEGSFSYRHIIEKNRSELSMDAAFSRTEGDRPAMYYAGGNPTQRSSGGGAPTNATLQADYFRTVGQHGRIEAGVKGFVRWNDFRYDFDDYDTDAGQWMPNRRFSNDLEHDERIAAAYVMYGGRWSDKWTYKAGARVEYSTSTLHQKSVGERITKDFWHPFPYFSMQYAISDRHRLDFAYNRRITRPTYPQLNPIVYVVDHTFHETGNKDLNPELTDKFELNYTLHKQKGHFTAGIYYTSTKDYITQVTHLASPENLAMTYANGSRDRQIGVTLDLGNEFFPWLIMTRAFTLFHTRTTGMYQGMSLRSDDVAFATSSTITVRLDRQTDVEVFMNLVSAVDRPQFKFRPVTYGNVTLRRRFLDNRLTATLTMTDVLNSDRWRAFSRIEPFKLRNYSKGQTQDLVLGLSYNFNSFKPNKRMQPKEADGEGSHIRLGQ